MVLIVRRLLVGHRGDRYGLSLQAPLERIIDMGGEYLLLRKLIVLALSIVAVLAMALPASAGSEKSNFKDADDNGIPDVGEVVTGVYTFSDDSCDYTVQYRGAFENDPYLNSGWIKNVIKCDSGNYMYTFVHESDPRYDGDPDREIWGTWEWHSYVVSGSGQLANPMHPEYAF